MYYRSYKLLHYGLTCFVLGRVC